MFANACVLLQPAVYSVCVTSATDRGENAVSLGTGFMIAPGVLVTVAHLLARHAPNKDCEVQVCQPRSGADLPYTQARVWAQDASRELLLLETEPTAAVAHLMLAAVPSGTSCGVLGYPHSQLRWPEGPQKAIGVSAQIRFRAVHIAAAYPQRLALDQPVFAGYELDTTVFLGTSGAPVFLTDGRVLGMVYGGDAPQKPDTAVVVAASEIAAFAREHGIEPHTAGDVEQAVLKEKAHDRSAAS